MIPKIIHYCWISGEENMPEDMKSCLDSWKKFLPDYQFINWNDENFNWNMCEFTKWHREHNEYAFCSDYVRFWALYNYGGIYLDCDVMVFKSFDELLKLKRIITKEWTYRYNDYLEAAIIGGEKGDELFAKVLDYYNNCNDHFTKEKNTILPLIMKWCWGNHKINNIDSFDDCIDDEKTLNVLNADKFFSVSSKDVFAQHCFKGSWWKENPKINCLRGDNIKIFLCAHRPIENYIPENDNYVIIAQNESVKDDKHEVIYLTDDEFSKTHNVCYSEGTAMRYLYNHPELIPEYICFGHYRRYFTEFVGCERFIPQIIDSCGAIIKKPFDHTKDERVYNQRGMYFDHPSDDINAFIESVKDMAPECERSFNELLNDHNQYACNCFAMKKEDFLEMCEMCFSVLDHFDEKQKYKNNEDVLNKMVKYEYIDSMPYGIEWQCRLQGFLLEWLTELFYRYKFGVEKCYKTEACYLDGDKKPTTELLFNDIGYGKKEDISNRKRLNWGYTSL